MYNFMLHISSILTRQGACMFHSYPEVVRGACLHGSGVYFNTVFLWNMYTCIYLRYGGEQENVYG